jgi:high-affinity nickel-transport protein
MMDLNVPAEALLLMFALGLRHGVDPDHLAMVDAIAFGRRRSWRTGAMFAAGHGAAVTAAAIAMHLLSSELAAPAPWDTLLAGLPLLLLAWAGTANLRALLRPGEYRPAGLGRMLLPRLGEGAHPLAAFGIGILFALVFDTASQIAAWGHAGGGAHGPATALLVGLAFSAGMVVVDALDGYLMNRMLAHPDRGARERYRRAVGWATVVAAYGVAAHGAASGVWPRLELGEDALTLAGAAMLGAFLLLPLWSRLSTDRSHP